MARYYKLMNPKNPFSGKSKCNFCEKKWATGEPKSPYLCPVCYEQAEKGRFPKSKLNLFKAWKKDGLL